jgi:histidyl-tRNA synthetase
LENNLDKTSGFTKFYYIGPMFRLERPQKGRLRQFHHIGVEAIGSLDADLDVEVISLADNLLKAFSIKGYEIKINSLGCGSDKKKLIEALRGGLKKKLNKLCPDCNKRYKTNTLRILDCKKESCREVVSKSEIKYGYLCRECDKHFAKVKIGLDAIKVSYELAPRLVRGLDYYTGTVFEIVHPDLGAQDALGAGGRYNNLIKELGGPDLGAVGFAFGVERLLLVMRDFLPVASQGLVYIISLGEEAKMQTIKLLDKLRKNGIASDTDYEGRSLKGAMRTANDLGVRFVIIIGEDEIKKNVVTLKDMVSGTQKEVNADSLVKEIGC